jgi:MarR family transcriptional regulator for hemolysin
MQSYDMDMLVLVHDVARLMRLRFDQFARTFGMTRAQGLIIKHLKHQPGMTQNEMACLCDVEPITVARLIDRLEANGFVERRLDPSDRRIRRLHLLPAAEPILIEIERYRASIRDELAVGVEKVDWETTNQVLLNLKNKLVAETAKSRPHAAAGE